MRDDLQAAMDRHPTRLDPPGGGWRRRRVPILFATVLGIGLFASLLAFGLGRDPDAFRSELLGKEAPAFALPELNGSGTIRLAEFRGQVVVVNFWASWCVACRVEHQALAAAWDRYRDQGVVVLGIVYQDSAPSARTWARDLGTDWPLVEDPGSRTALAFGVRGVPETFFIDSHGRIAAQHAGPITYGMLTEQITRLLRGAA